jgi:hypothetical protein
MGVPRTQSQSPLRRSTNVSDLFAVRLRLHLREREHVLAVSRRRPRALSFVDAAPAYSLR